MPDISLESKAPPRLEVLTGLFPRWPECWTGAVCGLSFLCCGRGLGEQDLELSPDLPPKAELLLSPKTDPLLSPKAEPLFSPKGDPLLSPKADPLLSPKADPLLSP